MSSPVGVTLADRADRAVFGPGDAQVEDADAYWEHIEAFERDLQSGRSKWQRLRAVLSIQSWWHR